MGSNNKQKVNNNRTTTLERTAAKTNGGGGGGGGLNAFYWYQIFTEDMNFVKSDHASSKLKNSDILKDLDQKLSHLSSDKRLELKQLILEYEHLFLGISSKNDKIYHDVELIYGSKPLKEHPYRMNPVKQQILREEVQYLLDSDFIEPSQSKWSSPCILVPTPDGKFRMRRTTVK